MLSRITPLHAAIGLVFAGIAVRVGFVVALPTTGDMEIFRAATGVIEAHGFSAYGFLNEFDPSHPFTYRLWPYPPGFMPSLLAVGRLPSAAFPWAERSLPVVADCAIAWLIVCELRDRRAGAMRVGAAVALVMLGPVFLAVSAVNGQIDGLAFAFVLLAARVWKTSPRQRRALAAGLLLGVGASIKTVPLVFVLAFLPAGEDRRERLLLIGSACLVPALALTPFLAADAGAVVHSLSYNGFPGGGGLTLLADPGLAHHYLTDYDLRTDGVAGWLERHGMWITVLGVLLAARWLQRTRLPPLEASVVLATVTLLCAVNFYEQYLLWLMPVALATGRVLFVALLEAVMLPYLLVTGILPGAGIARKLGDDGRAAVELSSVVLMMLILLVGLSRAARAGGAQRERQALSAAAAPR